MRKTATQIADEVLVKCAEEDDSVSMAPLGALLGGAGGTVAGGNLAMRGAAEAQDSAFKDVLKRAKGFKGPGVSPEIAKAVGNAVAKRQLLGMLLGLGGGAGLGALVGDQIRL